MSQTHYQLRGLITATEKLALSLFLLTSAKLVVNKYAFKNQKLHPFVVVRILVDQFTLFFYAYLDWEHFSLAPIKVMMDTSPIICMKISESRSLVDAARSNFAGSLIQIHLSVGFLLYNWLILSNLIYLFILQKHIIQWYAH